MVNSLIDCQKVMWISTIMSGAGSVLTSEPRYEKTVFCICENKDADQLRSNRIADQRLCFRYMVSTCTIPLLPKSEISSMKPSSLTVQPGLCQTWSETPKTGFLITRLICEMGRLLKESIL